MEEKKIQFTVAIRSESFQKMINDTLGDKELAREFISNITTVVSNNSSLQKCDTGSILSAGLTASSLNLPLSPTLGFAYVIPYGSKAQFQIGWKGLVQLAIRTGQYQGLGCDVVREGEYLGRDKLTGEPTFAFNDDLSKPIIGYYSYLKLVNGFTKIVYWSKEKCEKHARKYSKSYGTGYSTDNWTNMFDTMALKTVVKQLITKWGIMSVELQEAIKKDQAVIDEKGNIAYLDNEVEEDDKNIVQPLPIENKEQEEFDKICDMVK